MQNTLAVLLHQTSAGQTTPTGYVATPTKHPQGLELTVSLILETEYQIKLKY
jgi:hypothetical protein